MGTGVVAVVVVVVIVVGVDTAVVLLHQCGNLAASQLTKKSASSSPLDLPNQLGLLALGYPEAMRITLEELPGRNPAGNV